MFNVGDLVRLADLVGRVREDVRGERLFIEADIALGHIGRVTRAESIRDVRQRIKVEGSQWWCSSENFELVESVDGTPAASIPKRPVSKTGYGFDYS